MVGKEGVNFLGRTPKTSGIKLKRIECRIMKMSQNWQREIVSLTEILILEQEANHFPLFSLPHFYLDITTVQETSYGFKAKENKANDNYHNKNNDPYIKKCNELRGENQDYQLGACTMEQISSHFSNPLSKAWLLSDLSTDLARSAF